MATLAVSGCSGGDSDKHPASQQSSGGTASAAPETPLKAEAGKLSGRLPAAARQQAVAAVGTAVDAWFDAAYLDGAYPRTDFAQAFPGFTTGAAADATRDGALMSNRQVGARVQSVTINRKAAAVDLVATGKKAIGATARVHLLFTTTGTYAKQVRVVGRVFLSPTKSGTWQIFGYQIRKGEL